MNIQLFNDDCFNILKDINDNSVDLLFADLPYCGITNSKKDSEVACKWNTPVDLELFWKEINRVCKDTTPMFFTCSTKFGVSLINSNPKNFRYDLVWVKSSSCGFLNAKKMPLKKHEMVYVFYRKLPYYDLSSHKHKILKERKTIDYKNDSFIYGKIDRPDYMRKNGESSYEPPLPNSVIKTELYSNENKEEPRELYRNEGGQYNPPLPNSLLEIKSEKGKHQTQKPTALIEWCLKYYSKEGDTILDPTMGSGSTGVACKNMNRNFIGIEKDLKIFKIAEERINV